MGEGRKRDRGGSLTSIKMPEKLGSITFWITPRCNLNCKYCFAYQIWGKKPEAVATGEVIDALIRFGEENMAPDGVIWFFGGEPMVAFDKMREMYEKVRERGLRWRFGLTTNLTLVDEEKAKWLGKNGFSILCSLDGIKEAHDRYRVYPDGRGSWEDAWEGLKNVRLYMDPNPTIRLTYAPKTAQYLYESVKFLMKHCLLYTSPSPRDRG